MKKISIYIILSNLIVMLFGIEGAFPQPKLEVKIVSKGTGSEAIKHSQVTVHYTGWLENGEKFDSSIDRGKPFIFVIGSREVISGWDLGVNGMKVGEKRILTIPPELAYGKSGAGNTIPPNATLKFEISLLDVRPPPYKNIGNSQLQYLTKKGVKLFDIRRQDEWKTTGVIDKSIKLTAFNKNGALMPSFFKKLVNKVDRNEEMILICRTGNRTSIIANYLSRNMGYSKVYNVKNGIKMWIDDKLPVLK